MHRKFAIDIWNFFFCRHPEWRMLWSLECVRKAMLKHVSSSNLSPYKVQRCLARDTVSLSSSLSFGSSGAQEPLSSRSSSTSSLHDILAQRPPKVSAKIIFFPKKWIHFSLEQRFSTDVHWCALRGYVVCHENFRPVSVTILQIYESYISN